MSFPGRFADSLVVDQLDKIALSFLVDDLQVRRGGCAANIAFGLGALGSDPVLVAAVGEDFADYRSWLERHRVDCGSLHYSQTRHTARFICTTDASHAQIASFYAGAMSEARGIELRPVADRVGGFDFVVIAPNDPEAMLRHTQECRDRGYPFAADPLSSSRGPTGRRSGGSSKAPPSCCPTSTRRRSPSRRPAGRRRTSSTGSPSGSSPSDLTASASNAATESRSSSRPSPV